MQSDHGGRRPARRPVRFTAELGRRICSRVASGESQMAICAEDGMPSRPTLWRWVKEMPKFAAAFASARAAGGVARQNGRLSTFCQATADEIFARLCEGEPLTAICDDPAMPCFSTVYYWRRQFPEFAEALRVARDVQAERFFELGWRIAEGLSREDAYAGHVKLTQLRWMAGKMAPRRYGPQKAVEPAGGKDGGVTVILKRYSDVVEPQLGRPLEPGESLVLGRYPPPGQADGDDDDDDGA